MDFGDLRFDFFAGVLAPMSRSPFKNAIDRRALLKLLGKASLAVPISSGVGAYFPFAATASAQAATAHRFLQIFLSGGWDSILATDPVPLGGSKSLSGKFAVQYHQPGHAEYAGASVVVPGKSNLIAGSGISAAVSSFSQIPTAFVNGLFVEVTAHELAVNYLYSGKLSLSRSREYPAFIATAANKTGGFPAHVLLGGPMPLGETKSTNPPLHSVDTDVLVGMLAGPYATNYKTKFIDASHGLIATLNAEYQKRLSFNAKNSLSAWNASEAGLGSLYSKRFDQRLLVTPSMHTDFATQDKTDSIGAKLAMAFLCLREGVSKYVTVNFGGFDTHTNHIATHKPTLVGFSNSLNGLVNYLVATNDPDSPSKKLSETTTILITSEFNRTPHFNGANGTDHWQTGSAILMGKGVQDNVVIGSTDDAGKAADYGASKLLPDHLVASILRNMGFVSEANEISQVHLNALFV